MQNYLHKSKWIVESRIKHNYISRPIASLLNMRVILEHDNNYNDHLFQADLKGKVS